MYFWLYDIWTCSSGEETKNGCKSRKCIFIRYLKTSKAYKLFNPSRREIIMSRDILFDESGNMEKPTYEDI